MGNKKVQPDKQIGTIDASTVPDGALSAPDHEQFHAVADSDIKRLKHIETPVALAVAAVFTGAFLMASHPVIKIIGAASRGDVTVSLLDIGLIIAWALAFGVAITAAFVSMRRRTGVIEALDAIRRRPRMPVAPSGDTGRGHPDPRELLRAAQAKKKSKKS